MKHYLGWAMAALAIAALLPLAPVDVSAQAGPAKGGGKAAPGAKGGDKGKDTLTPSGPTPTGKNEVVGGGADGALNSGTPLPTEQRVFDGLASTIDMAATIAALAGCDAPPASVGRSLLPALQGESVPRWPGGVISEFGRRLLLETDRYKVIFDTEARRAIGLYDMLEDPPERRNLVDTPTGHNMIDALRWRLGDALLALRARPM